MKKTLLGIFFVLFFATVAMAQIKAPNYKSWNHKDREGSRVVMYKGKDLVVMIDYYEMKENSQHCLTITSRPFRREDFDESKEYVPWIMIYTSSCHNKEGEEDDTASTYIFERNRNWREFYRLWFPKWRVVWFATAEMVRNGDFSQYQNDDQYFEKLMLEKFELKYK